MKKQNKFLFLAFAILFFSNTPHTANAHKLHPLGMLTIGSILTTLGWQKVRLEFKKWVNSIPAANLDIEQITEPKDSVTTVFVHGFKSNKNRNQKYVKIGAIPQDTCFTFNFKDALDSVYDENGYHSYKNRHRIFTSCIAGPDDVQRLQEVIELIPGSIELLGVSRGASTILHYLALAPQKETKRIVRAIVESPFGNYTDIIKNFPSLIRQKTEHIHWSARYTLALFSYLIQAASLLPAPLPGSLISLVCPNTEKWCNFPSDIIHQIPTNIPILFICSEQDQFIPASSTEGMYKQLSHSGHPVYLLKTTQGQHAQIFSRLDTEQEFLDDLKKSFPQYGETLTKEDRARFDVLQKNKHEYLVALQTFREMHPAR